MIAFESPVAAALNHALGAESWARERLVPFAGAALELRFPLLPALRLAVTVDGRLRPAAPEEAASLVMTFGPEVLPALVRGEDHLLRAVRTSGDARFANEVLFLFRHLRWDAEEDLARVFGDAAAHRVASTVREFVSWHKQALSRVAENLMDHALEEQQLLVDRASFEDHRSAVAQLRDALERLEKRLQRLAG